MADLDTAPTTSYSDPIYDRLEQVAHRIRRLKWLILGLIMVFICLGLWLRAVLKRNPDAVSAVAYVEALEAPEGDKRTSHLQALLANDKATPFFRARAALDLAQVALLASKIDEAKGLVEKAKGFAVEAKSPELALIVSLAQGAVAEDGKDYDTALAAYEKVVRDAGAKFVVHFLTAAIGAARVEQMQGKHAEVIHRLDPVLTRTDEMSKQLMPLAKVIYWESKRSLEGGPKEAPKPAAAAPVTAVDGAASVTVAAPAAASAVTAPAVVPASTPVAPVAVPVPAAETAPAKN